MKKLIKFINKHFSSLIRLIKEIFCGFVASAVFALFSWLTTLINPLKDYPIISAISTWTSIVILLLFSLYGITDYIFNVTPALVKSFRNMKRKVRKKNKIDYFNGNPDALPGSSGKPFEDIIDDLEKMDIDDPKNKVGGDDNED
ncbi:MAG: hypothetical protein MJ208_00235 [Bacilli bacterium]|nr:hypothetical protein [Bacilli bacterium]